MKIIGPIVLVDDDDDDHAIFREVCTDLGVAGHLRFFHSGFELINFLSTSPETPFIVLCDINMPKLDGLALRELVSQDPQLKRKSIPFIFFSTSATEGQVRRAYDLTVQGFFLKGMSYEETRRKFELILLYWSDCRHPNAYSRR